MSQLGTEVQAIADALTKALPVAEAVATALAPEAAAAIATGVAIAKGVTAGVPEAIALWNEIQSGTVPSQAQLDAYAATEQTAYDQFMADVQAKLNAPA